MADKPFRFGPVAASNTLTTNVLNGPVQAAAGTNVAAQDVYLIIRHIRVVNKTAGAVTFSFWLGASAGNVAGTEVIGQGQSVAANSSYDWYGSLRMVAADFLVGGASAATSLSFEGEGVMAII
jgi:hypothetical protein